MDGSGRTGAAKDLINPPPPNPQPHSDRPQTMATMARKVPSDWTGAAPKLYALQLEWRQPWKLTLPYPGGGGWHAAWVQLPSEVVKAQAQAQIFSSLTWPLPLGLGAHP